MLIAATGGGGGGLDPDAAIAALDVHEELKASIFANEPMLLSPSNIDIDHRGRVWVCEIVNYRGHRGKRPEGDRILILSDTDGDGIADKSTVFYQGTDIDSPHGVCVLGTSDDKNTRAIVSAGDKVQIFIDVDGDLKADKKQVLFSGISGAQHDHGIHAFVFGPDGKLYFNFGNSGGQIKDADGKPIVDLAGNVVNNSRKPYQEGMVFRCNLDGSEFETVGWNFRNNWMATVDSFGSIWQSDNDDDGNRGVRINYVMEFGNYGYRDEKTGAGWNGRRPNLEKEIPLRHWHLNDPGVVPNLLQTGAGSPTGITVYEGSLLSKVFQNQVIHCDAGPNIVRAYPVQRSGAGYSAEMVNILHGARDNWFRPSDVSVAPDGSLIVADWYDPGVGGHGMRDLTRGRLFRLTPDGHDGAYKVPALDVSNVAGAIEALKSPNYATRYVAWQALHGMGAKALPALERMATTEANPRFRARAIWLMAKLEPKSTRAIAIARKDQDDDVRTVAIRAARQTRDDVLVIDLVKSMSDDKSAVVRRECAVALRHSKSADMPAIWAQLASHHDGKDRWYLEALGLASDLRPDECFAAWLKLTGKNGWNKPAGLDIVWRVRAKAALSYLPKAAKLVPAVERDRFVRSFDFHPKSAEKDAALLAMLSQ